MMPISIQQVNRLARTQRTVVPPPVLHADTPSELKRAAVAAAELSIQQSLRAESLWTEVVLKCKTVGVSVAECIFDQTIFGRSLAERVIEAGDWHSCLVLGTMLEDGMYAEGRIVKDKSFFMTAPDAEGRSRGVRSYPNGAFYGGDFRHKRREGLGVWDSPYTTTYVGEWSNDKMDGYGRLNMTYPVKTEQSGRYVAGKLVEPSRKNLWQKFCHLIK